MANAREEQAIQTLCAKHLHRALWLPETADHPKLRVTYATTSNFDDASLPAILFIGPLFSSRWSALDFGKLASDCGVRLICTDRPAMGGSTSVPINKRMAVWLETVPALLQELHITHVSFMTHSAGAIYTLNTLLHHRGYLDPENPKVAFLAPYVPMGISNATLPILLSKLPDGVINSFGGLNEFINDKVMASASWSGGLLSSTTSLFSSSTGSDDSGTNSSTSTTSAERFGVDEQTAKAIDRLSVKYKFAEDTSGINDEARLCLQKCADGDWGEAHDYADCIKSILRNEHTLTQQHPERPKLKVAAYFSGSDVMIGKRGEEYFKQCWQQSNWQEMIDFSTQTFPKANHDTVLIDYKKGALPDVFARVANSS